MSHWQKVKTHNKTGDRKKEIEKHFGIKQSIVSKVIESKVTLKSKKKFKWANVISVILLKLSIARYARNGFVMCKKNHPKRMNAMIEGLLSKKN